MADIAGETPKRKPGRPKGYPRSGGRAKGTPNKKNQVTRDYVIKEGAPLEFLCRVVRGKRISAASQLGDKQRVYVYPTLDQSIRAAEILSRKVLPDMKVIKLGGPDGQLLVPNTPELSTLNGAVAKKTIAMLKGL